MKCFVIFSIIKVIELFMLSFFYFVQSFIVEFVILDRVAVGMLLINYWISE